MHMCRHTTHALVEPSLRSTSIPPPIPEPAVDPREEGDVMRWLGGRARFTFALVPVLALAACTDREGGASSYSVVEVPLSRISEDLVAGRTTSVEITAAYIERIEELD